jgi:hypothetical protein
LVVVEHLGGVGGLGWGVLVVLGEGEGFDVLGEGWLVEEGAGEEPPFLGVGVVVEMAGGRVLEAARGEAEGVEGEGAAFAVPVPWCGEVLLPGAGGPDRVDVYAARGALARGPRRAVQTEASDDEFAKFNWEVSKRCHFAAMLKMEDCVW